MSISALPATCSLAGFGNGLRSTGKSLGSQAAPCPLCLQVLLGTGW